MKRLKLPFLALLLFAAFAQAQEPIITTTSLPNGTVGEYYSKYLEATVYVDYWYADADDELPPGIWIDYDGEIRGWPEQAGTYTFTVIAENEDEVLDTKEFSIKIKKSGTPIRLPQIATGNIRIQVAANAILLENLPSNTKVEVYNLQGKRIYSSNSGNSQILRIPVQTNGMYVVKAGSQTMRATVK